MGQVHVWSRKWAWPLFNSFTECAESAAGQATPEIPARRSLHLPCPKQQLFHVPVSLSALVISKKHDCFLCFLLLSPRASHYTLGGPCSQGSKAKGNWDKLPLQTFVSLLPNCSSFPAGEVLPPTLLGLPGYSPQKLWDCKLSTGIIRTRFGQQ